MQPRRRREASTLSDWPYLLLLVGYRDTPILEAADEGDKLSDAALEAAKVLFLASPGGEEPLDDARRGRVMGTVMGVAAFARTLAPEGAEPVRAVHSSRRRMVWYEAEPGYFVHATIALPRSPRHSRRASGATTSSAASATAPSFSLDDDVLIAGLRQAYREYRLRFGTLVATLENEGKAALQKRLAGFWEEWAETWDVVGQGLPTPMERVLDAVPRSSLLTPSTSPQLLPLLTQFAASNPSILPVLLHDSTVLSLPVIASGGASSSPTPPPPLSEEDLLALVRYLHRLLPPRRSLSVYAGGAATASAVPPTADATADTTANAWTAPFSSLASGMSSLLAPRPMSFSLPPRSSTSGTASPLQPDEDARSKSLRAGFAALRRSEKDAVAARRREEASAASSSAPREDVGWSLRSVSVGWPKLGFGAPAAAPATVAKALAEAALVEPSGSSSVNGEVTEALPADGAPSKEENGLTEGEVVKEDAQAETTAAAPAPDLDVVHSEPTTPAVELAPSVDMGELAEAMGATPVEERAALQLPAADSPAEDTAVGEKPTADSAAEQEKTLELLCGEGDQHDTRFHLRRYERGSLTLGLAMLPKTDAAALAWLDSRAERLLEAVESLLEVVHPPVPAHPQMHYVQHGLLVSSFTPSAEGHPPRSAETRAAPEDTDGDLATTAALLDAYRSLHTTTPAPVLESLTRLSTPNAPWVLHRRELAAPVPVPVSGGAACTDVYAVLSGNGRGKGKAKGRELSLVEAADEARRVLAAYRA